MDCFGTYFRHVQTCDASAFKNEIIQCFSTAFITKFMVSPLGNANFALGIMALPHKLDAHEHQGFSKTPQIPHFSFQALIIQNQKYAYAQGRHISQPATLFLQCHVSFRGSNTTSLILQYSLYLIFTRNKYCISLIFHELFTWDAHMD